MANKYDTLGHLIKEARLAAHMTRDNFAERIGMSVRYIASIENEGKKPSYNALCKIIRFFTERPILSEAGHNPLRPEYTKTYNLCQPPMSFL